MKLTCAQAHKIAFLGAPSESVEVNTGADEHPPGWIRAEYNDKIYVLDQGGKIIATQGG